MNQPSSILLCEFSHKKRPASHGDFLKPPPLKCPRKEKPAEGDNRSSAYATGSNELKDSSGTSAGRCDNTYQSHHPHSASITPNPLLHKCFTKIAMLRSSIRVVNHPHGYAGSTCVVKKPSKLTHTTVV